MDTRFRVVTALIAAGLLVPAGMSVDARQSQSTNSGQSQTTTSGTSNTSGQSQSPERQTNSQQGHTTEHGTTTDTRTDQTSGQSESSQQSGSSMPGMSDAKKSGMQSGAAISNADRKFMMEAAVGGMKEVELGRIAATKATNPELKQFAQKMVDEHSKVNDELKTLAASKGVTLPTAPDARLQATMTKMESLSGAEFDRAYLKEAGLKEHQKAERLFRDESTRGKDPETRAFAAKVLPAIQQHQTEVRGLESSMSNSRTSSGTSMNGGSSNSTNSGASSNSGSSSSGSGTSNRSDNSGSTSESGSSTNPGSTSSGSGSSTSTSSGQSGQGNQGGNSKTKPQ